LLGRNAGVGSWAGQRLRPGGGRKKSCPAGQKPVTGTSSRPARTPVSLLEARAHRTSGYRGRVADDMARVGTAPAFITEGMSGGDSPAAEGKRECEAT